MAPHFPIASSRYTHYSYLSSPVGQNREPTGIYNLKDDSEQTRRALIHNLLKNGELLAALPFPEIATLAQLRAALRWQDESNH